MQQATRDILWELETTWSPWSLGSGLRRVIADSTVNIVQIIPRERSRTERDVETEVELRESDMLGAKDEGLETEQIRFVRAVT